MSFLFICCASEKVNNELSKDEIIKIRTKLINSIRPLLKSDELAYMKCERFDKVEFKSSSQEIDPVWNKIGPLALRKKIMSEEANIFTLEYNENAGLKRFFATPYKCEEVPDAKEVDLAGMCEASEQKIFFLNYDPEDIREMGEIILKTMVRYYAIENYYKTFHIRDFKYSYTKQRFSAKGYFFKCL